MHNNRFNPLPKNLSKNYNGKIMSTLTEREKLDKCFGIIIRDEDALLEINKIEKYYLAILSNPNLVNKDTEPSEIIELALEYGSDYELDMNLYLARKMVDERFR
ncbi:hypothetical protein BMR07_17900, partial [Methylococcaceae bacterium CS1]